MYLSNHCNEHILSDITSQLEPLSSFPLLVFKFYNSLLWTPITPSVLCNTGNLFILSRSGLVGIWCPVSPLPLPPVSSISILCSGWRLFFWGGEVVLLASIYKRKYVVFVFLWVDYFTLYDVLKLIYFATNFGSSFWIDCFLYDWIIVHWYVYTNFLYQFIWWWTTWLIPYVFSCD